MLPGCLDALPGWLWRLNDAWFVQRDPKCQENSFHNITPPHGSMLSIFFSPHSDPCYRSKNRDSSDQATFFQSSIAQFW